MPELPEVETIKNGLSRFILFKEIKLIELLDERLLQNGDRSELLKLKKDKFINISRLGKAIVFSFQKSKKKLVVHLKMTGQLVYFSDKKALLVGGHSEKNSNISNFKHIRFRVDFDDNNYLVLNDTRRFAYLKLLDSESFNNFSSKIGIDPLTEIFTLENFLKLLDGRRKNVKAFLLDQQFVSGIGNIYADEVLFASGVSPFRSVDSLNLGEKKVIFANIKKILELAVEKRGTTFSDYVDVEGKSGGFLSLLKVYGRGGLKCFKCKDLIIKTKLSGRGTHYCKSCQK
ncbi:MAG: DNA-formamidopyrimidine glycosylase [Patescibacteria group bacterium]